MWAASPDKAGHSGSSLSTEATSTGRPRPSRWLVNCKGQGAVPRSEGTKARGGVCLPVPQSRGTRDSHQGISGGARFPNTNPKRRARAL